MESRERERECRERERIEKQRSLQTYKSCILKQINEAVETEIDECRVEWRGDQGEEQEGGARGTGAGRGQCCACK